MGEVNGVPRGGLRTLLIGCKLCESLARLAIGELAVAELAGAAG